MRVIMDSLSSRAQRALELIGANSDVEAKQALKSEITRSKLREIPNLGRVTMKEIEDALGPEAARLSPDGERVERLRATAWDAVQVDRPAALSAVADAERALKRIAKRAEAAPPEMERVELPCAHGPTLEFTGRLLAETQFQVLDRGEPLKVRFEVWETQGGAMIAATYRSRADGHDEEIEATVVEPSEDAQAMRFAVMEAFDWSVRARSMVRKLGWSLRQEVD